MNILFSANSGWNIYNFRLNLVKTLLLQKHKIIIAAPFDIFIEKLTNLGCQYAPIEFNSKNTSILSNFFIIFKYYKIFQKYKIDVFFGFTIKPNIFGSIVARLYKVPTINNITGLGTTFLRGKFLEKFIIFLYKFSLKKSRFIFFHNSFDQELFLKNRIVNVNQTIIIPGSGIDLNFFTNKNIDNINSSDLIFIFVGRIMLDKGINEFLEAAKLVKKNYIYSTFNVLGSIDNDSKVIKNKIKDYHNRNIINYLGSTNDVRSFINNADCIILPSYREGLSRTILEAFALSKPVISTNVPGCNEIVKDGINGLLCKSKDMKSLASTIIKFIKLPLSVRQACGKEGRKLVEKKYDEKFVIQIYLNCLSKL